MFLALQVSGAQAAEERGAVAPLVTACLSGAAKLARKNCGPRERGRKLEHCAAWSQRGESAVVCFCSNFSSFSVQYSLLLSAVLARWKIKALRATEAGSLVVKIYDN